MNGIVSLALLERLGAFQITRFLAGAGIVEAENLVPASVISLAHHGSQRAIGFPAPMNQFDERLVWMGFNEADNQPRRIFQRLAHVKDNGD